MIRILYLKELTCIVPGELAAAGQHASKIQRQSSVRFSIVAVRGVATDAVKAALDSKLEDIVYKTSVSFSEDLEASQLQALLQLRSADVEINVGQLLSLHVLI